MHSEELYPGIWRLSFTWKTNPGARTTETYVVNGRSKTFVIDVSKPSIVPFRKLVAAVELTGARMDNLHVLLTHFHLDHTGNVRALLHSGVPAHGGICEQFCPADEDPRTYLSELAGIPREKRNENVISYLASCYPRSEVLASIKPIPNWDLLEAEPFALRVISTPGHSEESCCFLEEHTGICFCGDTVIGDFTPPVNTTACDVHKLQHYLKTLDRLSKTEISLALPGHGNPVEGPAATHERITTIRSTYDKRLSKAWKLFASSQNGMTAYGLMERYVTYQVDPSTVSRYYAVSHVAMMLSYLEYFHDTGRAERVMHGKTAIYFPKVTYRVH